MRLENSILLNLNTGELKKKFIRKPPHELRWLLVKVFDKHTSLDRLVETQEEKMKKRRRKTVTKAKSFTFQSANRIGLEKFILISLNDMFLSLVVSFVHDPRSYIWRLKSIKVYENICTINHRTASKINCSMSIVRTFIHSIDLPANRRARSKFSIKRISLQWMRIFPSFYVRTRHRLVREIH